MCDSTQSHRHIPDKIKHDKVLFYAFIGGAEVSSIHPHLLTAIFESSLWNETNLAPPEPTLLSSFSYPFGKCKLEKRSVPVKFLWHVYRKERGLGAQVLSTELPKYLAIVPPLPPLSCLSCDLQSAKHVSLTASLAGSVFRRIWFCAWWSWFQLKSLSKGCTGGNERRAPCGSPTKYVLATYWPGGQAVLGISGEHHSDVPQVPLKLGCLEMKAGV